MFGKLSLSDEITEFQLWQEIGRLVRELSYRRVNIFRSIIFFSPETAAELHLADHKAWEKYIEQHIRILAQKTASVHSCNGLRHITTSRALSHCSILLYICTLVMSFCSIVIPLFILWRMCEISGIRSWL